ncbi:NAR1 ribosyltransferase, partial [Sitta europaea]|nr:NAR1 ribosyltransferase [Sitta europaea]
LVSLDMAPDAFDDRYEGCGAAMAAALPALHQLESRQSSLYARSWAKARAEWRSWGSLLTPLNPDQATALTALGLRDLYEAFNEAVSTAGRSRQEYRDKFRFKALHFLVTQALGRLREARGARCLLVNLDLCGVRYVVWPGNTVRFGFFLLAPWTLTRATCPGKSTRLQVYTCHSGDFHLHLQHLNKEVVLIPPFETFKVHTVTEAGDETRILLMHEGTLNNYNCEWLRGDSTGDSTGD